VFDRGSHVSPDWYDAASGRQRVCLAYQQAEFDLIATMDDATITIYSAFLIEEEAPPQGFRACWRCFRPTACGAHVRYLAGSFAQGTQLAGIGSIEVAKRVIREVYLLAFRCLQAIHKSARTYESTPMRKIERISISAADRE
jgi:hypothetical protein